MLHFLFVVVMLSYVQSWQLRTLDSYHANTIIRLWHELHVSQGVAHDFDGMLAPSTSGLFFAAVHHNEVRAIATCRGIHMHEACVDAIAHKPNQPDAAQMLILLLNNSRVKIDIQSLRSQPRWMLEAIFINEL